jgi:hypothetical protein
MTARGPPGAAAPARKRLALGIPHPWQARACVKCRFRESSSCQRFAFRASAYADPPLRRVLLFRVSGVAASQKRDAHAADSARSASLPDYRQLINPTGRNACTEGGTRLDDMARGTVFLGIRTIQERSWRNGAALCCAGAGPTAPGNPGNQEKKYALEQANRARFGLGVPQPQTLIARCP